MGLAIILLASLAACGSDSESIIAPERSYKESSSSMQRARVQTIYELGSCTYSNEYERIYVSNESDYYTCSYSDIDGYNWNGTKTKKSSSSSAKSSSSSAKSSSSTPKSSSSSAKSSNAQDLLCLLATTNNEEICLDQAVSSSSSSIYSSDDLFKYTNVSDVWNGKMEKPSTEFIEGKNYMLIYTAEELAYFADQVTNKGEEKINAKLMQHIRLNPDNMVDDQGNLLISQSKLNEWTPIGGGTSNIIYKGIFEGNGFTISGIYVNKPAFERAGFFGTLAGSNNNDSAHVRRLGIENSYIIGKEQVGGIAGRMNYAEIQQVFVRNSYIKGEIAGGIVGYKNSGWLYYAYNSAMIVSPTNRASGIAGYNNNVSTSITVCYNVGFLIAPNNGMTAGISTNANTSTNSFYLHQSDREILANGALEKTESFMTSEEFVSTLNGLSFDNIWTTDDDDVNDGFPVFKWERAVYK